MWDGLAGYLTGGAIFLLLSLSQLGQWRHDQSDVRQLRLLVAGVLALFAVMMVILGISRHS